MTESLKIQYTVNGGDWKDITGNLINAFNGSYNWYVNPLLYPVGENYQIRIITTEDVTDESDGVFEIVAPKPKLTLLDPNGNERIEQNTTFRISWNNLNFSGTETLAIEISNDGGLVNWNTITTGTVNALANSYDWFVNPTIYATGSQYRIRIRNTALDVSDINFKIIPEVVKTVNLTTPNGGEQIEQNSNQLVSWDNFNFIGSETLFVEYTNDDGSSWNILEG